MLIVCSAAIMMIVWQLVLFFVCGLTAHMICLVCEYLTCPALLGCSLSALGTCCVT